MITNRQEALAAVAAFATGARQLILGTSDGIKIAGLADKARDAEIYLNSPAQDPNETIAAALAYEVSERNLGETVDQLAATIIAKANQTKIIRAKLDGLEDRMKTAIGLAPTDSAAVQTYYGAEQIAIGELAGLGIDGSSLAAER